MPDVQVLVVDDEPDVREFLGAIFTRDGAQVSLARNGQQALALLEQQTFQVLFTDLSMPDMHGLTLLRRALRASPLLSAVVFTGHAQLDSCIEAMRFGACDYLTKPFTPQMIRAALARALDACQRRGGAIAPSAEAPRVPAPAGSMCEREEHVVMQGVAMREVCLLAAKIAPTDAAVLIRGEPGVGKEVVARAIHRQSRRAGGPFVRVACGAIREAELDAAMFGQEQTDSEGQGKARPGHLEFAHGGTLLLTDVECLPPWAQARLFDALKRGCLQRGGSVGSLPLDVRVIAATSCDLEAAVAEGRFHGGLYYLLDVVTIHVPPLRRRPQDIKILAEQCLAQALARRGIATEELECGFTQEAWDCLLSHDWPGNLPELAGVVGRAVALADGQQIGKEAMAWARHEARCHSSDTISVPLAGNLRQIERYIIEEVIQRCRGNKAAAARTLGLHRRTLYRMLEEETAGAGAAEAREARQSWSI